MEQLPYSTVVPDEVAHYVMRLTGLHDAAPPSVIHAVYRLTDPDF